ncbi:hypothetical protein P799_01085 [Lysinibacillus sphaericus CBAM5]|uniref:Uncharacterized protein n=1 Tax=Lysinibacillus sphaericus CBAM5 TaxID=1400869 RepID=W7SA41_LYSSH|nr:hypothetical protein P799_01085 [Lysinibacillus sphaericus CBAM5]
MWGWGEILSGFIAIFMLIVGILYSTEDQEKTRKGPVFYKSLFILRRYWFYRYKKMVL